MSALLCIITLLPIIPNSVPNFLNDLFEVFGHLASWKLQNTAKLPDEKLVHLQLGLQMLFHRLYGMYPCNFMAYLVDFIKRGSGGSIFQHTIKPLLDTVRVHPMLLTATPETEVNNTRWKEMEPHDVVMECANLSLPVLLPEASNADDGGSYAYPLTPGYSRMTSTTSNTDYSYQLREFQHSRNDRFNPSGAELGPIWSPHNEITASSSAIPLTPTTSFILPLQQAQSQLMVGMTGSSPPEAAVEATPETTPLKDMRELKQPLGRVNSHAVRAIFNNKSQPPSPMRQDQQNQFSFPDVSREAEEGTTTTFMEVTRVTMYEQRLQQVIQDRHNMERAANANASFPSSLPEINSELGTLGGGSQVVAAVCGECNETDRSLCSVGGLHMPTSRSMHQLAKGLKRRNRMVSYSGNETFADISSSSGTAAKKATWSVEAENPIRRAKSCSALAGLQQHMEETDDDEADCLGQRQRTENGTTQKTGSRLQRSGRILAMAAPKEPARIYTHAATQTVDGVESAPAQYENWLIQLLLECKEQRNNYERSLLYPQDILDEYIKHTVKAKETFDAEQGQLMCLQLAYESYRRSIHAERNRRLMGRSRDKRSLETEAERLREQLKNFDAKNKDLANKMDQAMRLANERQNSHQEELADMRAKYQHELEEKKCLRQANDDLQTRLTTEVARHKEMNYELESLRGQVFSLGTELQHAQQQADLGLQCKQELARLEAEFIIMGEVQVRCRDRLAEIDNFRARDEELQMLQESSHLELKGESCVYTSQMFLFTPFLCIYLDLRHSLDEKTSQLESMKHKISDLQAQLANSEKAMTEQKRLLSTVKDEYEEKFKVG